jgi:hypothetical protein
MLGKRGIAERAIPGAASVLMGLILVKAAAGERAFVVVDDYESWRSIRSALQ